MWRSTKNERSKCFKSWYCRSCWIASPLLQSLCTSSSVKSKYSRDRTLGQTLRVFSVVVGEIMWECFLYVSSFEFHEIARFEKNRWQGQRPFRTSPTGFCTPRQRHGRFPTAASCDLHQLWRVRSRLEQSIKASFVSISTNHCIVRLHQINCVVQSQNESKTTTNQRNNSNYFSVSYFVFS